MAKSKAKAKEEKKPTLPVATTGPAEPRGREDSGTQRPGVPNRISMVSILTDSTNLGEIPERKWPARHVNNSSSEDYNCQPIYPLKLYKPEVKERRFWGLFRRSGT
jgi:hypothetical protein